MTRVWIDLSDDQSTKLRHLSKMTGFSRADLIRLAVRDYLVQQLPGERRQPICACSVGQPVSKEE